MTLLNVYLISIALYMLLITGGIAHFYDSIFDNGWLDAKRSDMNPFVALFLMSAIPIFRIICVCCIVYMATHTYEEYKNSVTRVEEDDE